MEIWERNLFVCWFGVFATSMGLSQLAPLLPLYIEQLGVHDLSDIEKLSGVAYGVTFILMAVFSPIWGHAADKYGRKPMLLRASLGMAIVIASISFAQNVWQLIGLRFLQGTISGYYSASITLVATQTPNNRSGWALGILMTASVTGMLIGPLVGGFLSEMIGIRNEFLVIGALLLVAFTATFFFIREDFSPPAIQTTSFREVWSLLPNPKIVLAMFVTTMILHLALTSIQPILTIYIAQLTENTAHVALISGVIFASSGLASIMAAPRLGKLTDTIGPHKVILVALIGAGILFIPQSFVRDPWELMGLRFLLGIATAGLLPSINTLIKQLTPNEIAGRIFGYNQSAQFAGGFAGSVLGGEAAAWFGIDYVFFFTGALLLLNSVWVYFTVYKTRCRPCDS